MADSTQISLKHDLGLLCVRLVQATLSNRSPESFAKVHVLPDRRSSRRIQLNPLSSQQEMMFGVEASDLPGRSIEVLVYDVTEYNSPQVLLGVNIQFARHECVGSVRIPLNALPKVENAVIVKCEEKGVKARSICQLLRFKEDFRAFCTQFCTSSDTVTNFIDNKVINPTFDYILDSIERSRPPVLYLIGRSGEGKSSLINGLANRHVAEVGDIEATTVTSKSYFIEFEGGTTWQVYDTRGLSETTTPDGATGDPISKVKREISDYKPDAILYVVAAKGVRNCINELNTLSQILSELQMSEGAVPPVIAVLTHADMFGRRHDWPPEAFLTKQQQLKDLLDLTVTRVMHATEFSPIDEQKPFCGYITKGDKPVLYVVPVAVPLPIDGDLWNVETLSSVLGRMLPSEARYQFYQAQRRPQLMKQYTNDLIKYFSGAAAAIGALPLPGSDTLILTQLQLVMISFIALHSGRDLSLTTATEFVAAMGLTYVAGQGCLQMAQSLIKLVPVAGCVISASLSGASTLSMGKSAQAYFFDGQTIDPRELQSGDQVGWHDLSSAASNN